MKLFLKISTLLTILVSSSDAFSAPIFTPSPTTQVTAPSKTEGVEIELPNFDELFGRIQQVSPLAQVAFEQRQGGFKSINPECLEWKQLDANKKSDVFAVEKIDDFQGLGCPILRLRAHMDGPAVAQPFAEFIMNLDLRKKWDPSIAMVDEIYPIKDLDFANLVMGVGKYGDCNRLGVGYCRTKKYLAVPGREQLTLCGIQDFEDGSTVVWGTEMEDWHNHLLPEDIKRTVRAKSHLFSIAVVPTSENTFDVEYCLQIDTNFPNWATTPILTEVIKGMFRYAKSFYSGPEIEEYIKQADKKDKLQDRNSILMTP